MTTFLNKALKIIRNILWIPAMLFCAITGIAEMAGYPFVDDLLLSLRVSFTTRQLTVVGFFVITAWLLCFFSVLWLNQKEQKAAAEMEAQKRIAQNFDPNRTDEVLRRADTDVKNRILLEKTLDAYRICYRRVKKTYELVVNGMVYREIKETRGLPHELTTHVDGHEIRVGCDVVGFVYIVFDGKTVAKKLRLL